MKNKNKRIWLSSPHMSGKENQYIEDAFKNNWIAPLGPNVDEFEKSISKLTNVKYVAALSSGTAAIHLALIMLDVKSDDEVICPSFTFSASANPICYQNAIPVFIDSEKDTWNMCPELLEKTIKDRLSQGKKPKAIILVHLYGMPAKIEEIIKISQEYNIPIIEDAAEALGSMYKNKYLGTFGDIGIYSFNGNKIITTSGGGALVSNNEEYCKKAIFLSTQARDDAPHYQHSSIGYNYRLSNILAGIGRGQLQVLKDRVISRRKKFNYYKESINEINGLTFLLEPKDYFSNRWLTCILTNSYSDREKIRLNLEKENIESRPLWKPMHLQPIFRKYPNYLNGVCESLFEKGLCLPSGSNLSLDDQDKIIDIIINTLKK